MPRSQPSRPTTTPQAPEGRGAFGGFIGPRTLVGQVKTTAPYLFDRATAFDAPVLDPQTLVAPNLVASVVVAPPVVAPTVVAPTVVAPTVVNRPSTPRVDSHPPLGQIAETIADLPALESLHPPTRRAGLIDEGFDPLGWWRILLSADRLSAREHPSSRERADYFALCLAAHFASAATYVPTDVDAKIRHALWFEALDQDDLARMRDLALHLAAWDMRGISARIIEIDGAGALSGHDGERLSVLCGGMLGLLGAGDTAGAERFETAIDDELAREATLFDQLARAHGRECDLLRAAAILTHNAGDVRQGLAAKSGRAIGDAQKQRFADLAQSGFDRYGGSFGRAAELYRELMASEGHRNYPLREVKLLRADPALLLPIGPFLDDWGASLARWPRWNATQRAEVVSALIDGCRKVEGQESYYRALAGFDGVYPGGIEARDLVANYGSSVKRELKNPDLRRKIAVRRESFESSYRKRARAILARA